MPTSPGNAPRHGGRLVPAGDPVRLWRFRLPDGDTGGFSAVPVPLVDGSVFAGDVRGALHAVDAETGAERWRFQTDATEVSAAAAAAPTLPSHAGLVYATGWAGLSALEAAGGAERWRLPRHAFDSWRLHAAAGAVYAAGPRGLTALDAATGAVRWRFVPDGDRPVRSSYSPATTAAVLVDDAEGGVLRPRPGQRPTALAVPAPGRPLRRVPSRCRGDRRRRVRRPPLERGPRRAGPGHRRGALALRRRPTRRGRRSRSIGDVQVAGGVVCVDVGRGHVLGLDGATGAERWRYRAGADTAGLWPAGDALYVDSSNDDSVDSAVAALDAASGAERWRFGGFAGLVIDLRRLDGAVVIDLFGGVR